MKKMMLLALLFSSVSFAAEVVVMEAELPAHNRASIDTHASFYIDMQTGEGFVKAEATEVIRIYTPGRWCQYGPYGTCIPDGRFPQEHYRTLFKGKEKVEGLMLMNDELIYHSAEGDVNCGKMKPSRILKRPTLYLSGKCDLQSKVVDRRLVVTLVTK